MSKMGRSFYNFIIIPFNVKVIGAIMTDNNDPIIRNLKMQHK